MTTDGSMESTLPASANIGDWKGVSRQQIVSEIMRLRESITRLMKSNSRPTPLRHISQPDDFVPLGWAEQHAIEIPRADGVFESPTAWVRVTHGVITAAGLKNQSILSLMISRRKVDEGEELSARLYIDWKTTFLASLDAVKWTAEIGHGDPEAWSKEDRYSKLLHRLEPDYLFAMDAIVSDKPKAKHIAAFGKNEDRFIRAFKVVVGAIRDINREADQALQAATRRID